MVIQFGEGNIESALKPAKQFPEHSSFFLERMGVRELNFKRKETNGHGFENSNA